MSRITDSERGARIALQTAQDRGMQPELLDDGIPVEFWDAIADAARMQIEDEAALRMVRS